MTKIKGTGEHGLLQIIIRIIRPPLCSCVPLQMVICKEDGSPDNQNQGDGGGGVVANDHPEDPASSLPLHGLLQMIIWMIRPPPCSSVPLQMVICKEEGPPDDQHFFWSDGAEIRTRPAPSMEDPQFKISA